MSETRRPTAIRRELGQRLRALRDDRQLTVAETAEQAGFSQAKLTKIELAQVTVRREDVLRLLDIYELADGEQRELLLDMVRGGRRQEWWQTRRSLPPKFASYLGLESVAAALQVYETTVVQGLLQTPDYARALLTAVRPELFADEIDRLSKPTPDELDHAAWFKSTRSNGSNTCVEVARAGSWVAVRDSKDPRGPVQCYGRGQWCGLLDAIRDGRLPSI